MDRRLGAQISQFVELQKRIRLLCGSWLSGSPPPFANFALDAAALRRGGGGAGVGVGIRRAMGAHVGRNCVGGLTEAQMTVFKARAHERGKQRMRSERLGFEFGVKLAAHEPRVVGNFHDLDVRAIGRAARDAEPGVGERRSVFAIEFVAMAMAFGNLSRAVRFCSERAGLELAGPRAKPHRAAHLVHPEQLAKFVDHAIGCGGIELRGIGVIELRNLARVFVIAWTIP